MKTFAIFASMATAGAVAAGAYHFVSTAKEKAVKEKAAKEQFSYNNVIVKFKEPLAKGDPLANAASGYANIGLKNFNEGEKLLEQLETKPETVNKETVDAIFKSNHPFYRFLQGFCYEKGIGVASDKEKAYESYGEAQKLPFSRVRHALCLIKGLGVKADPEKGIEELSSLINFSDAKPSPSSGSAVENGDGFRTAVAPQPSSEFPPAASALARVYLDGQGVPKNHAKALACALVAYANGLDESSKLLDEIFSDALSSATEKAESKFHSFSDESSPEYKEAVKAFREKNKSLQSMPELLAKETAKKMKELKQGMLRKVQAEECAKAGWALAPNGKDGMSIEAFRLDCAKCFDSASGLLCSAQKSPVPESVKNRLKDVRETLKSLSATAKTYGLADDQLVLDGYAAAIDARANDPIKTSDFMNAASIRKDLADFNANKPSSASLVAERHLMACEVDYVSVELNDATGKLQNLEASSPVKKLEFNSREHTRFDSSGKTALEEEADKNGGIKFKKSEALNNHEAYEKTVSSAYAVSVNGGEGKNVSRVEFGALKSSYDTYLAEKARLSKLIDKDQKALQFYDRNMSVNKSALAKMLPNANALEAKAPAPKDAKTGEGSR